MSARVTENSLRRLSLGIVLAVCLGFASRADAGFKIVPTFDDSIKQLGNATQVMDTIKKVIAFYESKLTDDMTVNITFMDMNSGLGQSQKPVYIISYSNYLAALTKDATSANDTTALNNLPQQYLDPVLGSAYMYVFQANLKALGIKTPEGTDGIIGLNTGLTFTSTVYTRRNKYDLYAVVCHELDECLGLGSAVGANGILPHDLYRYDANGQRSFTTNSAAAAYFSIDGTTRRARFNQVSFGDYGDFYSGFDANFNRIVVTPQAQDAFATPGVTIDRKLTNELLSLDVIGYDIAVQKKAPPIGSVSIRYSGTRMGHQMPGPIPTTTKKTTSWSDPKQGLWVFPGQGR